MLVLRGCIIIGMSSSYYDLQGFYRGFAPCRWYKKINGSPHPSGVCMTCFFNHVTSKVSIPYDPMKTYKKWYIYLHEWPKFMINEVHYQDLPVPFGAIWEKVGGCFFMCRSFRSNDLEL